MKDTTAAQSISKGILKGLRHDDILNGCFR